MATAQLFFAAFGFAARSKKAGPQPCVSILPRSLDRHRGCDGRGLEQPKGTHAMSNKPSFIAYAVRQRPDAEKANWTAIGVAWAHKKGGGFNIELEATPLDGRIVLMPPKDDEPDGVRG
jgi:hypothetical protein